MKLIIQIDSDGNPIGHPITLGNFILAFPDLDISGDTAPDGYAWFTRKDEKGIIDVNNFSLLQTVEKSYTKTDDGLGFEDTFIVRDKTTEEFNEMVDRIKNSPPDIIKSWTLNTNRYVWVPPIKKPGGPEGNYRWDESIGNWIECVGDELPMKPRYGTILTTLFANTPTANT